MNLQKASTVLNTVVIYIQLTNDGDDEEDNGYQTITLETEDVEEEIDEPQQTDFEIDKSLDIPIVTDDEQST